jgi:hypothetical protein
MSKIQDRCFLCRNSFHFGPHAYDRRAISAWGIMVCSNCRSANRNGIVPTTYPHLVPHLVSRGVVVQPNAKGWIEFPTR